MLSPNRNRASLRVVFEADGASHRIARPAMAMADLGLELSTIGRLASSTLLIRLAWLSAGALAQRPQPLACLSSPLILRAWSMAGRFSALGACPPAACRGARWAVVFAPMLSPPAQLGLQLLVAEHPVDSAGDPRRCASALGKAAVDYLRDRRVQRQDRVETRRGPTGAAPAKHRIKQSLLSRAVLDPTRATLKPLRGKI